MRYRSILKQMDCIKNEIIKYIELNLTQKRLRHTYSVASEAVKLAERYGCDTKKAELAAFCHDMFRSKPAGDLDMYVKELGLPQKLLENVNLSHGKVAAEMMKRRYHIDDKDMINAVAFHTTGRKGMSVLEKIIFLADAIEPGRNYPGVEEMRKTAYTDLDKACIMSLERTVQYVRDRGEYLDPDTEDALNDLKEKQNL